MPVIPQRSDAADDKFLFDQGPARGLSGIRFPDYHPVFERSHLPNVAVFVRQIEAFRDLLAAAPPDEAKSRDTDLLLAVGELFTLVVYAQLLLENAEIHGTEPDLVDQMFDVIVRDFSEFAVQLHGKASVTPEQAKRCLAMIQRPVVDDDRFRRVWRDHVHALRDAYEMNP